MVAIKLLKKLNGEIIIKALIGFLVVVALLGFHGFKAGFNDFHRGLVIPYMLVIGFPLLWILPKDKRNPLIVLFLCAFFLRQSWICFVSLLLSMVILYWEQRKLLIPLAIIALMTLNFMGKSWQNKPLQDDWKGRCAIWQDVGTKWQNHLFGDGKGKVAEYKSKGKTNPACPQAHNDWLHIAVERGIVVMIPLAFIFFIPLAWVRFDTLYYKALWASYINLLIQTFTDFPLHRTLTLPLAITLLFLVWSEYDTSILKSKWQKFLNS